MTKRGSLDNVVTYEHYCDTKSDLNNIPKNQITLGSVAIILKDENDSMGIYIATSQKEWIEVSTSMNSGGGDAPIFDLIHICSSNEYNENTKVPTIEEPEENIFYLVPNNGENNDLFDEWIWTNENWEKFGVGKVGATGEKGDTGTTFTPAVSAAGVISWTNDGGKTNPANINLVDAVINALPSATGVNF